MSAWVKFSIVGLGWMATIENRLFHRLSVKPLTGVGISRSLKTIASSFCTGWRYDGILVLSLELGTHGCFISNLCTVRFCEETPLAKFNVKR